MDSFFKGMMDQEASNCPFYAKEIQRCPFLRNIDKPTNFSLSPMSFPIPAAGARGPIFEDGPSFDTAFKVFHGKDGIVPLTERSSFDDDRQVHETAHIHTPQFNPLAGNVATISLSAFGPGGPFSFGPFSDKWKKQQKKPKPSNKQEPSSQGGDSSKHEALGNEWLKNGNCPIAKSYRAVSGVLPLVATVLRPPPGMKLKCPAPIIAARAALSKTALVKNLRPQPLPAKMLAIALMGMAANVPLGVWREHTEKFSVSWFVAIHAAVPFIAMLRKSVLMPKTAMAMTIGASILGQIIGSRAERYRLKAVAEREKTVAETALKTAVSSYNGSYTEGVEGSHCSSEKAVKDVYNMNVRESSNSAGLCY